MSMTITTLFAIFSPIYSDDFIAYLVYASIVAMAVLDVDARAMEYHGTKDILQSCNFLGIGT